MAESGKVPCGEDSVGAIKMAESGEIPCGDHSDGAISTGASDSVHNKLDSFAGFVQKRVLSGSTVRKLICVEGTFEEKVEPAIVILEKKPFCDESLKSLLTEESTLKKVFSNDIYGNYECFPRPEVNTIKATVIHPATEQHIKKYEAQPFHIVEETPELYRTVTLPHLEKEQFDIQWVDNILTHKSEEERIVFEDPNPDTGFILLPDLKWNGVEIENLYLVAIIHKKGIKSLRDLAGDHLSILENVLSKSLETIEEKYHLSPSQLRVYVHYQPSYYHFHVHFTNLSYDAPGITVGKAHLLSEVISNLKLLPDYYERAVLPFLLKESSALFLKYQEMGVVKKVCEDSSQPSSGGGE